MVRNTTIKKERQTQTIRVIVQARPKGGKYFSEIPGSASLLDAPIDASPSELGAIVTRVKRAVAKEFTEELDIKKPARL